MIERRPVDRVSESVEYQAQLAIDTRRPVINWYNPPLQDTAASDGGAGMEEEPVFPKTTSHIKQGKFIYKRKVCTVLSILLTFYFYSFSRMCVPYFPVTTLDLFLAYIVMCWVKEPMVAS